MASQLQLKFALMLLRALLSMFVPVVVLSKVLLLLLVMLLLLVLVSVLLLAAGLSGVVWP